MSKLSRTKGHSFERFIARCFKAVGYDKAARQLEYQIDQCQGVDIAYVGPYRVQCKKTKKYVSMNTIQEIKLQSKDEIPVLIAQGDNQEPLATLPLSWFLTLVDMAENSLENYQLTKSKIDTSIKEIKNGKAKEAQI